MTAIPTHARDQGFSVAIAELPLSAVAVGSASDAEIVVDPASGLPGPGQVAVLGLRRGADAEPRTRAVTHRPRLRPDAVADVIALRGWFPRIEVEVTADPDELWEAIADAAGWARVLAAAELEPGVVASSGPRAIGYSRAGDAVVTWQVRARGDTAPSLRILGVGPQRVQIRVDGEPARVRVSVHGESRECMLAVHWETAQRLTLRRAVDAVRSGMRPADLDDARRDMIIADWLDGAMSKGR